MRFAIAKRVSHVIHYYGTMRWCIFPFVEVSATLKGASQRNRSQAAIKEEAAQGFKEVSH